LRSALIDAKVREMEKELEEGKKEDIIVNKQKIKENYTLTY